MSTYTERDLLDWAIPAKDPNRKLIVIDPVVTDTAKLADIHLRVRPGVGRSGG